MNNKIEEFESLVSKKIDILYKSLELRKLELQEAIKEVDPFTFKKMAEVQDIEVRIKVLESTLDDFGNIFNTGE
jgi:SMC interacting uncharacterized protein involved in chromosome segregation